MRFTSVGRGVTRCHDLPERFTPSRDGLAACDCPAPPIVHPDFERESRPRCREPLPIGCAPGTSGANVTSGGLYGFDRRFP